jgi:hypothetical protein
MQRSMKLQAFLETLLSRHKAPHAELHMQLGEREQMVVSQSANRRQIRLSRFTLLSPDTSRKELEIMFFVDEAGRWIPYEYFRPATQRQVCGVMNRHAQTLVVSNPLFQRGLVIQCDLWATRLQHEGWLEHSTKVEPAERDPDVLMLWPLPTVDEPDDDQIETWLMDVELCEATDGCQTEPDGICPHGYPSWLRYLGLV